MIWCTNVVHKVWQGFFPLICKGFECWGWGCLFVCVGVSDIYLYADCVCVCVLYLVPVWPLHTAGRSWAQVWHPHSGSIPQVGTKVERLGTAWQVEVGQGMSCPRYPLNSAPVAREKKDGVVKRKTRLNSTRPNYSRAPFKLNTSSKLNKALFRSRSNWLEGILSP